MPRRATRKAAEVPTPGEPESVTEHLPEDDFVSSLKSELVRTQKASGAKTGEDLTHRAELNKRLLQDLWEVHNQFEEVSVHLTVDPSQTLFATFVEYPDQVDVPRHLRLRRRQDDRARRPRRGLGRVYAPLLVLQDPRGHDPPARDLRVVRRRELPPVLRLDADDEPGRSLRLRAKTR